MSIVACRPMSIVRSDMKLNRRELLKAGLVGVARSVLPFPISSTGIPLVDMPTQFAFNNDNSATWSRLLFDYHYSLQKMRLVSLIGKDEDSLIRT